MQKIYTFLSALIVLAVAKLLPFNVIIGSHLSSFSWSSVVAPVLGYWAGMSIVLGFLLKKSLFSIPLSLFLLHRLPLVFSTYAFSGKNIITSWIVPVVCMLLFVMHPEGTQAWPYALYWFVPMVCCFVDQTIMIRSLSATFVAHAIGSVVWLYTGTITAVTWWALIPVVACERLLMTGMMVACYYAYVYGALLVKRIIFFLANMMNKECS